LLETESIRFLDYFVPIFYNTSSVTTVYPLEVLCPGSAIFAERGQCLVIIFPIQIEKPVHAGSQILSL